MSKSSGLGARVDRRQLLKLGGQAAGAGVLGSAVLAPGASAKVLSGSGHKIKPRPRPKSGRTDTWPSAKLPASAGQIIESDQFFSTAQLAAYGQELNLLGLRATGAANTEAFIRTMAQRLQQAGVQDVHLEPCPLKQWLATSWSLTVNGKTLPSTFYIPYTKQTPASGVTAELVMQPADNSGALTNVKGKIAVFEVPYEALPIATFDGIAYTNGVYERPGDTRSTTTGTYSRPYLNTLATGLQNAIDGGAVGVIGIWPDLPGDWAKQYTPYDAVFRPIPGLWIDSIEGTQLKELASAGATATINLQATVQTVMTNNIVGYIPGISNELTVLHTHTDGTNGVEENGPIAVLATAQYLARLPQTSLERTVMVMLSTGHFAEGVGIRNFITQHANDIIPRITSLVTYEHLGCLEWLPTASGAIEPTGNLEFGAYFCPSSSGLVNALETAQKRDLVTGVCARPAFPANAFPMPTKESLFWPGEGTYWYVYGALNDGNFITGPYGLIAAGLDITGMVNYDQMRIQAMSSVQTILQLAATSDSELKASAG